MCGCMARARVRVCGRIDLRNAHLLLRHQAVPPLPHCGWEQKIKFHMQWRSVVGYAVRVRVV